MTLPRAALTGRRHVLTWTVGALVGLLVVLPGIVLLWSKTEYRQWPWSAYPNPLNYCGRDYLPAREQTRAQILASGLVDFHKASDLPGFLNSGEVWTAHGPPPQPTTKVCDTVVWVRLSGNRFEEFALEGGP